MGLGLGLRLTRGMRASPPLKPTPMGYGGAWVGGMSLVWALRARHVTLLARPTPGFKPTPMGPRPNPSPRVVAWAFSANPRPNPSPIPMASTLLFMLVDVVGVQDDVVMPVKERNKKLIEKVVDFLEADCYLYSPLVTKEHVCYKSTHGGNMKSGGQMQKENTVGEGGDLRSQLRARAVVKKTVASGESVKHMVH
ncbi:hypothetical protein Hanom_Chr00s062333g01785571 [Helianthus anomalus]